MRYGKLATLLAAALWAAAPTLHADIAEYQVNVNTNSMAGQFGVIDFQFNGLNDSQFATISVTNFTTTGSLTGLALSTGDVAGTLPGTVTMDNGGWFNDYQESMQFGSSVNFDVTFSGPAVSSPNGTSTSGSTFALSFTGVGAIPLFTTDASGATAMIDLNLDASLQTIGEPSPGGPSVATFTPIATVTTPEPGGPALAAAIALSFAALAGVRRSRSGRRNQSTEFVRR